MSLLGCALSHGDERWEHRDWFLPVPADEDTSYPLRRVITAPDSRPPRLRPDNDERLSRRLQQHDLPMCVICVLSPTIACSWPDTRDWFATEEGVRSNGARAGNHGYTRSLDLLDNSM